MEPSSPVKAQAPLILRGLLFHRRACRPVGHRPRLLRNASARSYRRLPLARIASTSVFLRDPASTSEQFCRRSSHVQLTGDDIGDQAGAVFAEKGRFHSVRGCWPQRNRCQRCLLFNMYETI